LSSREKVAAFLREIGVETKVREFDESTKNSELAAKALGCTIAEIAKSIVFVGARTSVVIISGDKRVSVSKLGAALGDEVRIATPDEVREKTGYPIGGVPPFPHGEDVWVFADNSLARFDYVWAAAGAPNAVFRIRSKDLAALLGTGLWELAE
jgi:prolyl-tRNA editing enzyme YbaK/EbsC (Cys-tRNA(Pro) deacylase)